MKLFLQKNAKFSSAGGFAPKPPDPHWPAAAGGSAPRLPKQPPHCEFLATRLSLRVLKKGTKKLCKAVALVVLT